MRNWGVALAGGARQAKNPDGGPEKGSAGSRLPVDRAENRQPHNSPPLFYFPQIPDPTTFDGAFFAVHNKQASRMDPQLRKLLEVTAEAWVDAGIDARALRGSDRVGVYCGSGGSEIMTKWLAHKPDITGEWVLCGVCVWG